LVIRTSIASVLLISIPLVSGNHSQVRIIPNTANTAGQVSAHNIVPVVIQSHVITNGANPIIKPAES